MSNVIQFPTKDERQWREIADILPDLLANIGATHQEIPVLIERLRPRWEQLGKSFTFSPSFSCNIPGPLNQEQTNAITSAIENYSLEVIQSLINHYKEEHAETLTEFAKLELRLLRAE